MSVKIEGLEYLKENDYSNIIIDQRGINYNISITPQEGWMPKIKNRDIEDIITDKMSSKEKVEAVMNKFYEQNGINKLGRVFVGYDDERFYLFKSSYRQMFVRVNNYRLKDTLNKGYQNYEQTRDLLLYLDNNKKYEVVKDSDCYGFEIVGDTTKLTLNCSQKNLPSENEFFKKMINSKLNEQDDFAHIEYVSERKDSKNYKIVNFYLICGEFELKTSDVALHRIMMNCVSEYNEKRNKEISKYKQLKLNI